MTVEHAIPALNELIEGLERAFEHHLEVEQSATKTLLLRMAGREFRLAGVSEDPQDLRRSLCANLAEVAAFGLATSLTDESRAGTRLRMDLVSALAVVEATAGGRSRNSGADDDYLTTAEAASQLGMSRPYVSMLCNQGKLGEVSRSEGGHRRIRQSAVDAYKKAHLDEATDNKTNKKD